MLLNSGEKVSRLSNLTQSMGNLKVSSGGISWNKSGGGKEIRIPTKGKRAGYAEEKQHERDAVSLQPI